MKAKMKSIEKMNQKASIEKTASIQKKKSSFFIIFLFIPIF
jgi:hypothetical protein